MSETTIYGIGSEPILDRVTDDLQGHRADDLTMAWLRALHLVPDLPDRADRMAQSFRKHLLDGQVHALVHGLLTESAAGRSQGIAALAAALEVEGPGDLLLDRVRGFSNLHRMAGRFRNRGLKPGSGSQEEKILRELAAIDAQLDGGQPEVMLVAQGTNVDPREAGPARHCLARFGTLELELTETGRLDKVKLAEFLRLCRLELDAASLRAGELAGSINPYRASHVTAVMPLLASIDGEGRDLREFVDTLEESGRTSLFREKKPAVQLSLDDSDYRRLLVSLQGEDQSTIFRRLLLGVQRHPVPNRTLAWFCDRLLRIGIRAERRRLRKRPLDLVECCLLVFEHFDQGGVHIPAGNAVCELLRKDGLAGVSLGEGYLKIEYDAAEASRMELALGLPDPALVEAEESLAKASRNEGSVKDLVASNINNTSILLGLLKNPKVIGTPGVVALVVQRSRNMRVMDVICMTRGLHAGQINKDVPLALLKSPMNISVKALRKFINVRYVSKTDLHRLARDKSAVRREVGNEVEAYLNSLK